MHIVAPLLVALIMVWLALRALIAFWVGLKEGELRDIWNGSPAVNRIDQPFFYWLFFVGHVAQITIFGYIGIGALGLTVQNAASVLGFM